MLKIIGNEKEAGSKAANLLGNLGLPFERTHQDGPTTLRYGQQSHTYSTAEAAVEWLKEVGAMK